jgi:hypothetical protein
MRKNKAAREKEKKRAPNAPNTRGATSVLAVLYNDFLELPHTVARHFTGGEQRGVQVRSEK